MTDDAETVREAVEYCRRDAVYHPAIAALSRLTARLDAERWQPIDTAPKDGGEFDGWNGIERVPDVSWDDACPDDTEGVYHEKWWRRIDTDSCVTWCRIEADRRLILWRHAPTPPEADNG